MNILFYLHKYPSYGGIENVTLHLANYLVNKGVSVQIFSYVGMDFDVLLQLLDKRVVFHKSIDSEDVNCSANLNQLRQILVGSRIDCVIFQDSYAPVETLLFHLKDELGTFKLVTVEHNTPDAALKSLKFASCSSLMERIKFKYLYPFYYLKVKKSICKRHKLIYGYSDKYVLLTDRFRSIMKYVIGIVDDSKIIAINNPITIKTTSRVNWEAKQKICLFPARLVSQKGINYLMDIWTEVEKNGTDWTLEIVGDGPERQYVEKFIYKHHLKHVKLKGFHSDMIPFYEKSSMLLATSIYEGWPLTLSEAMTYGCVPVVFGSYLAATEIVTDGLDGYVIPPFDVKMYVARMQSLMHSSSLRNKLAISASKTCQRYSVEKIGTEWEILLKGLLMR